MLKKFSIFLCIVLSVFYVNALVAFSEAQTAELPYFVSDVAGILSESQQQSLNAEAESISEEYNCGVYIVTLDDFKRFDSSSDSFWTFSQAFYNHYQMGIGEDKTGILLIMSMEDRDYSLLAHGMEAHYAFTDYGKGVLEQQFLDDFRQNDWYGGFEDYLSGCRNMLARAAAGDPLDVTQSTYENQMDRTTALLLTLIPPLGIALIACESMKRSMKPVSQKHAADDYILRGGVALNVKQDVFLNRTVNRRIIRTEVRESSSHGGGTSINSGGFSGHSGKF